MSTIIDDIEAAQRSRAPRFDAGDRVRVHFQVVEGNRRRTQVFEGIVIKRQGSGLRETFTVRKQSFGVGVERTFPLHSPKIEKLEVAGRGSVRRAKLYYLRDRVGKGARVAERRWGIEEGLLGTDEEAVDSEGASFEETVDEAVEAAEAEETQEETQEAEEAERTGDTEQAEPETEGSGEETDADSADDTDQGEEPEEATEEAAR